MRVLLTSQEMPPDTGWGGIGTYVATLAPALSQAGAEVRVLSVVRGQAPSDTQTDGVIVHRRPLRRPPGIGRATRLPQAWERLSLAAAVDREVRRLDFGPDVLEAPEWRAEGLVVAARRTAPVIVRLHSAAAQLFAYSGRAGPDARLSIALERRAVRTADMVVSTRSNLADVAAAPGGRDLVARPIGLPVTVPEPAGELPPTPRVTFIGRLERRKGPETLVAAARAVLDEIPTARFTFVGADTGLAPGSYQEMLASEARRLEVAHAVEFLGHRSHPEAMSEVRRSWVCAFPARHETFGYGPAEAAAAGRAVIASPIPPFRSLFGDDGAARLVPLHDVGAWAAAIVDLLGDPAEARRQAAAGRERVLAECAPALIAAQMLDAYEAARHRAHSTNRSGRRLARVA
ncbi:MAG TPA: glycosyltransferase family 4 protein [Solirubrobacteraceae bacterium]|jgi:glycosyltransferase involved in cell wall biosynthesis|nr:glycosyltransferase family 4 protein [Solirubrobacteraceae bacterium]